MSVVVVSWCVAAVLCLLYYMATKNFSYWKRRGVPCPEPRPFFGNYLEYLVMKRFSAEVAKDLCEQFKDEPYFGTYFGTKPALVVLDPEILKLVFTKDFYYFNSRELMHYTTKEVTTQNIFFSYGDRWKVVRQNLTPLFSSIKLKHMFHLIVNNAHIYEDMLDYEYSKTSTLNVKNLMKRYTMDCICSCAFGCESKSMDRKIQNNPFTTMGSLIFSDSYYRGFKHILRMIFPGTFYGLGMRMFPAEIDRFFNDLLTRVFESRNYEPSSRNDFVDSLLNMKKSKYLIGDSINNLKSGGDKKVELEVTQEMLVSQCVAFFGGGFETSASVLSLTLYELAKNPEVMKRAQREVDEYMLRHNNKLEYECIKELPFLEACLYETLRLYPVMGVISREVVEEYTLPSGLRLDKELRVHVPVYYLHRNPEVFPEPDLYKPERFLPEARASLKPYTFFPYGEGPRTCIGVRFSKMQILPGLVIFLKKFSVSLAPSTPRALRLAPTTFLLQPTEDINLELTLREDWERRVFAK